MKSSVEGGIERFIPPVRQIVIHCLVILAASFVIGPLIGTQFFNDPRGRPIPLSVEAVLVWGMGCAFILSFFYVGWLVHHTCRSYRDHQAAERMRALGQPGRGRGQER